MRNLHLIKISNHRFRKLGEKTFLDISFSEFRNPNRKKLDEVR